MSMSKFATQADYWKDRALSYEAANMEQGKLLNEVIKERDELRKALQWYADRFGNGNGKPTVAQKALAKCKS